MRLSSVVVLRRVYGKVVPYPASRESTLRQGSDRSRIMKEQIEKEVAPGAGLEPATQ
jgi:hypothetical protein